MKQIIVIGGMGAGKSSVAHMLADCGLPLIDLDTVGHQALTLPEVKQELVDCFGDDILDEQGNIVRHLVAQRAFVTPEATAALNAITLPRISMLYKQHLNALAHDGHEAVVAEFSSFQSRDQEIARNADIIIAVVAPLEERIARATTAGWNEDDVRNRIRRQITDKERIAAADVVFENTGSLDDMRQRVQAWWQQFQLPNSQ